MPSIEENFKRYYYGIPIEWDLKEILSNVIGVRPLLPQEKMWIQTYVYNEFILKYGVNLPTTEEGKKAFHEALYKTRWDYEITDAMIKITLFYKNLLKPLSGWESKQGKGIRIIAALQGFEDVYTKKWLDEVHIGGKLGNQHQYEKFRPNIKAFTRGTMIPGVPYVIDSLSNEQIKSLLKAILYMQQQRQVVGGE